MQNQQTPEELPLHVLRMVLKDRSQQYFNMLTCIHDLTPTEREKLTEWMTQTDELISNLPPVSDAEVAFHPEVL